MEMLQLTEREVIIIVIGGTAAMFIWCLTIIGGVLFINHMKMKWAKEMEELRANLKK